MPFPSSSVSNPDPEPDGDGRKAPADVHPPLAGPSSGIITIGWQEGARNEALSREFDDEMVDEGENRTPFFAPKFVDLLMSRGARMEYPAPIAWTETSDEFPEGFSRFLAVDCLFMVHDQIERCIGSVGELVW